MTIKEPDSSDRSGEAAYEPKSTRCSVTRTCGREWWCVTHHRAAEDCHPLFGQAALDPLQSARSHIMCALDLERLERDGENADAIVDAILDALVEVHDEIEGAQIKVGSRSEITVHTSSQVCEWLYGLMKNRTA